jgi:hypothetical protein
LRAEGVVMVERQHSATETHCRKLQAHNSRRIAHHISCDKLAFAALAEYFAIAAIDAQYAFSAVKFAVEPPNQFCAFVPIQPNYAADHSLNAPWTSYTMLAAECACSNAAQTASVLV